MENNTLREIGDVLKAAESVLIFTHLNMDGDAIGSTCALCHELRKLGKNAWVLLNDDHVAEDLQFMIRDYTTNDTKIMENPDITITVDASELSRFPEVSDKFLEGKIKIAIDHHVIQNTDWDYNYIDPEASAAGELIFGLFEAMDIKPDQESAEALFAAITTDSGNFQYSNTTKRTHEVAAKLYDSGINANRVSNALYECVRPEKIKLKALVLGSMEFHSQGKAVLAYVTQSMLEEAGAILNDAEGIVAELRSMKGVEVAVLLKEENSQKVFGSFRSKNDANVREIAAKFGGGGHEKAAGCTFHYSLAQALTEVRAELDQLV